jgi:aminopeptidase N
VAVGLLGANGKDLPLTLENGKHAKGATTVVLELTEQEQIFRFRNVDDVRRHPSCAILGAGDPEYDYTDDELLHLFSHDSDPVNRWEAGQRLAMERLLKLTKQVARRRQPETGQHLHQRHARRADR